MADSISTTRGTTSEGFERVRSAFAANFAREDTFRETGAAIAIFHRGECVVDLVGGRANAESDWASDTLVNVWSATKGVMACAIAKLVDCGAVRYEDRVASVWPEFGTGGKSEITLAQILSHSSGLNGFAAPTSVTDLYDWEGCCAKLAAQEPAWPPGTKTSYHALTFGWLVGEVIRRVSGTEIGEFLRETVTGPVGADIFVGLPEEFEPRVADLAAPRATPPPPDAPPVAFSALLNPIMDSEVANTRAWRAAVVPAANGQASAVGLARLYATLSDRGDGGRNLLSRDTLDSVRRPAAPADTDLLMGLTGAWGMGVMCNPGLVYGPNPRAFGHSGWGGSFGCVDPELDLSIGYVCGQMGAELVFDPRSVGLAAAASACAGDVS